ncbi:MAG TPA: hypothetical protein VNO14_10170 [Blastocatellia bacterium]|nr:hypothetical protein [Blastocatellia bacterium]
MQTTNRYGQSKGENTLERAKQLWEMAIAAKGGRERLYAVESIAITETLGNKKPSVELCVFPDKYWYWEDYRPGKLGLAIIVNNFEQNVGYFVVGHQPNDSGKRPLDPEERSYFMKPQLLYLLETRWLKPELLRAYKGKLGSRNVDIVEIKVDQFRIGVFLDKTSHLPVRINFLNDTGDKVFQWYGLSDYREVNGILVPHAISYDGGRSIPLTIEVNVAYDPAAFEQPPRVADGPDQWRAKGYKPVSSNTVVPKPEPTITIEEIKQAIRQLQDKDDNIKIEARDLLLRAGRAAIPSLTEAIKSERGENRYRIAIILQDLEEESIVAMNAFREMLLDKGEDGLLRRYSAFRLAESNKGIEVLISLMKDKDVFVRRSVVFAFDELTEQSEIPEQVKEAVPVLREPLKDRDEIVRGMAEEVLEQIGVIKVASNGRS